MVEEERRDAAQDNESDEENQTGDPGRTPGTAEGDEQTVDEDLKAKEGGGEQ
ncbi:MAG TPA: hypothetical protein VF791_05175 [Pyrinomonadaceae bacterium]